MEYSKPIEELIRARRSCRTFDGREIEAGEIKKLKEFLKESSGNAKDIPARFALVTASDVSGKVGTYGMITGAKNFIVGIMGKDTAHLEDFGYAFEKIILFATSLGLGTCWLAGIDRETFGSKLDLGENELVAVVSPVGYALKPRMKESLVRMVVRADKRKPFETLFFEGVPRRPLTKEKAGNFAVPLEMARLAPSAANKQPLRIILDGDDLHFCLQRTRIHEMPIDVQKIDAGIAMCHFELAARARSLAGVWADVPDANTDGFEYIRTWRKPKEE